MPPDIVDITPGKALPGEAKPLIVLLGTVADSLAPKLKALCRRVLASVAQAPGAVLVDDAGLSNWAPLIGQTVRDEDAATPLVGIVEQTRTADAIEPNHTRILRLPADCIDNLKCEFLVLDQLAAPNQDKAIAILAGGSDFVVQAVLRCIRRNWPVLVLAGSGGLADELNARQLGGQHPPLIDATPEVREIMESATLYISSVDASVDELKRLLLNRIDPRTNIIREAWARFDDLDQTANNFQKRFKWIEAALIDLAVLAAALAVLSAPNSIPWVWRGWAHSHGLPNGTLHLLLLLTPVTLSIFGAFNSHFREGNKWILLRGSAESIKRHIYRYRAHATPYTSQECAKSSPELAFAANLQQLLSSLEKSEVNKVNLDSEPVADPKRESMLQPEQYLKERLHDQIGYFVNRTRKLTRSTRQIQWLIYLVGGAGTVLAAYHYGVWVALATATGTALTTRLQTDQTETTLVQYNQTLASLRSIDAWWQALSSWEQSRPANFNVLVDQTEKALEAETAGWLQQMQSALDKLTEKEANRRD